MLKKRHDPRYDNRMCSWLYPDSSGVNSVQCTQDPIYVLGESLPDGGQTLHTQLCQEHGDLMLSIQQRNDEQYALDSEAQDRLADHLIRNEFRQRDFEAKTLGNAHIAIAAAAYVMKLAKRLGHDDLSADLNREVNEYLADIETERKEIAAEFETTGLGPIERWWAGDVGGDPTAT